jgi:hypothetical protein
MNLGYDLQTCKSIKLSGCGVEGTKLGGLRAENCNGIVATIVGYNTNMSQNTNGALVINNNSSVILLGCCSRGTISESERLFYESSLSDCKTLWLGCTYKSFYRNSAWRAISNNADDVGQHVSTITGTTTAFGILGSYALVSETRPVSAICTSHVNALVIPFRNDNNTWAFSIIGATNLSLLTNVDVTIEVIFANEYNLAKYSL